MRLPTLSELATSRDMIDAFGARRKISLCREITKLTEEVIRTTIGEALALYEAKEPRGEYVLVIEGASESDLSAEENPLIALTPAEHVEHYVNCGMEKMDAIKAAAKDRKMSKSEMYKLLI